MKKLKIISANVCGNKRAAENLNYPGRESSRVFDLVFRLAQENPDILMLQEISYLSLGLIESSLQQFNYRLVTNEQFKNENKKGLFSCLTVIFLKVNISFKQETIEGFETQFRCIAGAVRLDENEKLYIKCNHVPSVAGESGRARSRSNFGQHMEAMLRRKVEFLNAELNYQKRNQDNLCLCIGDYNCAEKGEYHAKEIFTQLPFADLIGDEPTWGSSALDHIFISQPLLEKSCTITHRLLSYPSRTDHKVLVLVITL